MPDYLCPTRIQQDVVDLMYQSGVTKVLSASIFWGPEKGVLVMTSRLRGEETLPSGLHLFTLIGHFFSESIRHVRLLISNGHHDPQKLETVYE